MRTLKFLMGMVCLSFFATSCSKDETESEEQTQARVSSRIDEAADDITRIVLYQYDIQTHTSSGGSTDFVPFIPTGVTVTDTNTASTWNKVVSFRTTGVTIPSGNVLKGVVIMSGTIVGGTPSNTINCRFTNFYHNNYKIEGTYTIVITNRTSTLLSTVHPVATVATNLTITKGSTVYLRNGSRICEQIEGATTRTNWLDNMYKITGTWTTTISGNVRTSTVTTPLVVRGTCGYISTGVVTTTRPRHTTVLNFGAGTCDSQAVQTVDGVAYTITLGN